LLRAQISEKQLYEAEKELKKYEVMINAMQEEVRLCPNAYNQLASLCLLQRRCYQLDQP
jgi:hypothetical protein